MRSRVCALALSMSLGVGLTSCQTKVEMTPPPQPVTLNYTMLGIWPQRYMAYDISGALQEAGIRSQLSGGSPCVLNVEAEKLDQAREIIFQSENVEWIQNWRLP